MKRLRWAAGVVILAAGCGRAPEPAPDPEPAAPTPPSPVVGTGRFPFSAIRPTVAPACGAATELLLADAPITGEPTGRYVSVGLHGDPTAWSNRTARVKDGDLSTGWGGLWTGDGRENERLRAAEVRFLRVTAGQPAEGQYTLKLSNGEEVYGWFRATWLPHPGR